MEKTSQSGKSPGQPRPRGLDLMVREFEPRPRRWRLAFWRRPKK